VAKTPRKLFIFSLLVPGVSCSCIQTLRHGIILCPFSLSCCQGHFSVARGTFMLPQALFCFQRHSLVARGTLRLPEAVGFKLSNFGSCIDCSTNYTTIHNTCLGLFSFPVPGLSPTTRAISQYQQSLDSNTTA
jgi:hypothetical protein